MYARIINVSVTLKVSQCHDGWSENLNIKPIGLVFDGAEYWNRKAHAIY